MTKLATKNLQILIIVLVTALAFSNIFQNQFLIDDQSFITNWEAVRSLDKIPNLLMGEVPEVHKGVFRPLRSLLYAIYYQLWGVNPFGYHLHSLLVHLLSTVLVYLIVDKITQKRIVSFISALLFGLHPIHTESITYISASMEMTGVVFLLSSFYLYLKDKKIPSLTFATLAFFTYEMTLTLPLLVILYEVCFKKVKIKKSEFKSLLKSALPYFLLVGVYLFVRVVLLNIDPARGNYLAYSFYHTQLTMIKVYVKYLKILIFPDDISYLHQLAPGFYSWMTVYDKLESILNQSLFDLDIFVPFLLMVFLVGSSAYLFRKYPYFSFSVFWFFISLLPVSYIFPQGIALAEKYLYTASFGAVFLTGWLISKLVEINKKMRYLTAILVVIISGFFLYLTYQRNYDWHDPITFWTKAAKQQPQSPLARYNLGILYGAEKQFEKASDYYQQTIELEPKFWEAHFNLGNTYLRNGKKELAQRHYRQVLLINPNFEPAKVNLEAALR